MSARLAQLQRRVRELEEARASRRLALTRGELLRRLKLTLDPWQQEVADCRDRRLLLNCARQSGKSTVVAFMALERALLVPDSLILVLSPGDRQSKLLFETVMRMYRKAGRPVAALVENKLSLELANGSRIFALPGNPATVRGFASVDLMVVDEAAQVPDELMAAVMPMLIVSSGQLVTLSTPYGRRGWWFSAWEDESGRWTKWKRTALENPRITPEALEAERRSLPRRVFESEYLCEFTDTESSVFAYEDIQRAITEEVVPLVERGAEW